MSKPTNQRQHTLFLILIVLLTLVFLIMYIDYEQSTVNSLPIVKAEELVWEVDNKGNGYIVTQPLISDNKLYVQTNTKILAYNIFNGNLIWESQIPQGDDKIGSWEPISMEIDQSQVVIQSQKNTLVAFDRESGLLLWEWENSRTKSYISISDVGFYSNMLLISSHNSDISAINISDETIIWSNNNVPSRTKLNVFPLDGKILLATNRDIVIYNPNNGQLIQEYLLDGIADSYSIDNEHLYIAYDEGDCTFVSFNVSLMQNDWCVNVEFDFLLKNIDSVYDNNNIYFFGNRMFAIDKKTGSLLWETVPEKFFKNPVILSDFIYVSDSGSLYKINKPDGMKILKMNFTPPHHGNNPIGQVWRPIITSDLIFAFGSADIVAFKNKMVGIYE